MKFGAVIVGGGSGSRLGADIPKAFVLLGGKPIYFYSVTTFLNHPKISEVIFVTPKSFDGQVSLSGVRSVAGGKTRQTSVFNGLKALSAEIDAVLVHDAARPFVTAAVIDRLIASLSEGRGGIAALPISDTVKLAEGDWIVETIERSSLWSAQTPQAFPVALLRQAYARAAAENGSVTDEASLIEKIGEKVRLIPGASLNFKITTPDDLALAETILKGM